MTGAPESLLTVREVADLLRVSRGWVYDRARTGEIPSAMMGKHLRFRLIDVTTYIETCMQ